MGVVQSLSRLGQVDGAGSTQTLFLEVAAGEVQTAFEELNVMRDLHTVRTISEGKSARFPIMGQGSAQYHLAGNDLFLDSNTDGTPELGKIKHAEQIISIDDVLIADTFITELDEFKNHYDVRSLYTQELGRQLAYEFDKATLRTVVAAARSTNPLSERPAGGSVVDADFLTNGTSAVATMYELAQKMDEAHIPKEGRSIVVPPVAFYNIIQQTDLVNKDITDGGNGDFAKAIVHEAAGIKIYKSVHLSGMIGNDESSAGSHDSVGAASAHVNNDVFGAGGIGYGADFTNTAAICFHKEAIGTVKLMDLAMESEYFMNRQGTLMLAKYAMGHGILRPEAAFEVVTA